MNVSSGYINLNFGKLTWSWSSRNIRKSARCLYAQVEFVKEEQTDA
jgi:hypothetical protein